MMMASKGEEAKRDFKVTTKEHLLQPYLKEAPRVWKRKTSALGEKHCNFLLHFTQGPLGDMEKLLAFCYKLHDEKLMMFWVSKYARLFSTINIY
jgi:hypothetical protein